MEEIARTRAPRIARRPLLAGSVGLAATAALDACAASTPPTTAPAAPAATPAAATQAAGPPASPTLAPAAATPAPGASAFALWNRDPSGSPKSGGDLKGTLGDFWTAQSTIWTYAVGAMNSKRLVFNTLLNYEDPTLSKMLPELAERWDLSADGKTVTFALRHGVTWHDGAPFTAKDVEFTLRAHVHKDTVSTLATSLKLDRLVGAADFAAGKADRIAGVQVPDDFTIKLTTEAPVYFLFNLSMIPILPEHVLGKVAYKDLQQDKFTQEPIGTGPFKFVRRVPDQFLEVARNDSYWGGKPYLDRIISTQYKEMATAGLAFENGEIDFLANVRGPYLERLRKLPNVVLLGGAVDFPNVYRFNLKRPYLQDKRVRQALVWAVDHQAIKDGLYGDMVQLTNSALPHPLWEKKDLPNAYTYDPGKAKQLLRDAGWNPEQEILLNYYYSDQTTANQMTAVQQYWSAVGVKAQTKYTDSGTATQMWKDGNADVTLWGAPGSADPDLPGPFLSCDATPDKGGSNLTGYCNRALDDLFEKGRTTADYQQRKAIYDQVQVIMNDDLPYAPFWVPVRVAVVRKRVVNATYFQDYADGNYAQRPETWYLAP
jgi:peptide/nickel transport system substrate-binding protein